MTTIVGYLCHPPFEATNATKMKATKNEAMLSDNKISPLRTKEV
jgi:hypothetical protein